MSALDYTKRENLPRLEMRDFVVELGYGMTEEGTVYWPAHGTTRVGGKLVYLDVNGDQIFLFDHEIIDPDPETPTCDICHTALPHHQPTCLDMRPISAESYRLQ
jgi:hypothetical protein